VPPQLTDLGDQKIEIGMPVEMVTRKLRSDRDDLGMLVYEHALTSLGVPEEV
jgi:uncharacterized protein